MEVPTLDEFVHEFSRLPATCPCMGCYYPGSTRPQQNLIQDLQIKVIEDGEAGRGMPAHPTVRCRRAKVLASSKAAMALTKAAMAARKASMAVAVAAMLSSGGRQWKRRGRRRWSRPGRRRRQRRNGVIKGGEVGVLGDDKGGGGGVGLGIPDRGRDRFFPYSLMFFLAKGYPRWESPCRYMHQS